MEAAGDFMDHLRREGHSGDKVAGLVSALVGAAYMLDGEEVSGAKKVLTAAAMTYIASAATALLQLLRLVAIRGRRD